MLRAFGLLRIKALWRSVNHKGEQNHFLPLSTTYFSSNFSCLRWQHGIYLVLKNIILASWDKRKSNQIVFLKKQGDIFQLSLSTLYVHFARFDSIMLEVWEAFSREFITSNIPLGLTSKDKVTSSWIGWSWIQDGEVREWFLFH